VPALSHCPVYAQAHQEKKFKNRLLVSLKTPELIQAPTKENKSLHTAALMKATLSIEKAPDFPTKEPLPKVLFLDFQNTRTHPPLKHVSPHL
jgi:hypothetical protein